MCHSSGGPGISVSQESTRDLTCHAALGPQKPRPFVAVTTVHSCGHAADQSDRTRSCSARVPGVSRRPGAQLQDLLPDQPSDALDLMILQRFVDRHLHSGRRVFRAGRSRPRPVEQFHRGTRVDMHWRDIDASSDAAPDNRVAVRNVGAVLVVHVRAVRRRVGYHDAGCCSEQDRCPITGPETTKSDRSS